jgi:penicillin-binding protein 2
MAFFRSRQNYPESKFKGLEEDEIPFKYRDHAWFVAFAPYDKPEIAVVVMIEHGGHGGKTSAPLAREVIKAYFETRGITKPTSPNHPPLPEPPGKPPEAPEKVPVREEVVPGPEKEKTTGGEAPGRVNLLSG